jgi:hypothetical protein
VPCTLSPEDGNIQVPKRVLSNTGRWADLKSAVIPSVVHSSQSPLKSICFNCINQLKTRRSAKHMCRNLVEQWHHLPGDGSRNVTWMNSTSEKIR